MNKNTDDSYSSNYDERYSLDSKHTDSKDTSRENSSMKSSVIEMKETESKSQTGVLDDNQKDSLLSMLNDTIKYMVNLEHPLLEKYHLSLFLPKKKKFSTWNQQRVPQIKLKHF